MKYGSHKKVTPEGRITAEIRYVLKLYGVFHWKNWGGPMGTPGISDILACWKGKMIAIEVKAPKGKLSPAQENFLKLVNDNGGIGFVARSAMDVINTLGLRPGCNQ
jgi:hypothetical protein